MAITNEVVIVHESAKEMGFQVSIDIDGKVTIGTGGALKVVLFPIAMARRRGDRKFYGKDGWEMVV